MSSGVCQGLQSRLEMVESRFLKLKLPPPITIFTEPYNEETDISNDKNDCKPEANRNADMGGWTFLRSFSDTKAPTENDKVYVHPLVKRSASRLSEKSLEMCTERLGSETGSEVSDCSDDISLLSLETRTVACDKTPSKPRESSSTRKISRGKSFPPPLTSISGSNGVRVKSRRENGRLVIEAVSFHPCHSYFHAERSDGRLRLSLFKDTAPVLDADGQNGGEEEEEEEESDGEIENNVGGEIGTGKLPRPCSCKESGRGHKGGLLNWKPYLVAT
ncbi:FLORAL TRANSITION AT THE MERISTEM5, FANTASTIC FOUR 2 [Hibiscus trionum]|uniref:FLORAL TRANSITION AT THE MERISTEM5, FANTASTIC FOUR 2 n=1 Tax=Hibiscus trionum TaxID=183268 RepID=A0A9W7LJE6_HIBTR|nr:FLORAL TRANSITION AT THE MERISTEM5, FANTASTIC FOUR 2 [Hibiscus trionum]